MRMPGRLAFLVWCVGLQVATGAFVRLVERQAATDALVRRGTASAKGTLCDRKLWASIESLDKLTRVDDPREMRSCAHQSQWFTDPAWPSPHGLALSADGKTLRTNAAAATPILELARTTATVAATPSSKFAALTSSWSTAAIDDPQPVRLCVVEIDEEAIVLPSGLIITATHRFDLGFDWHMQDPGNAVAKQRRLDADRASRCDSALESSNANGRGLFSFRFLWGNNPSRAIGRHLPPLCAALEHVRKTNSSILSSGSLLFDLLVGRALGPSRVFAARIQQPVFASSVRLIVSHPGGNASFPHGESTRGAPQQINGVARRGACASMLLNTKRPREPTTRRRIKVIYLARSPLPGSPPKRVSTTGRNFDNEHELLNRSQALAHRLGFDFEPFIFTSIEQQAAVFSSADVVAGPQGTAFSGLAFARRDIVVVEFILQRTSTYNDVNLFALGAYIVLQPHWYWQPKNCGGSCAPWHLTEDDMQDWLRTLGGLAGDAAGAGLRYARTLTATALQLPRSARRPATVYNTTYGVNRGECHNLHRALPRPNDRANNQKLFNQLKKCNVTGTIRRSRDVAGDAAPAHRARLGV
jgi:hypothetical protein